VAHPAGGIAVPLYEYVCNSCKKKIEVLQSFDEKPLRNCPHCGGRLKKLLSSPAIQFKGSGWYVTDYAGKGKAPEAGAEKASESKTEARKTEKAEKPAEKPSKKGGGTKKD
jgi:putative FmdB family regulatory protein